MKKINLPNLLSILLIVAFFAMLFAQSSGGLDKPAELKYSQFTQAVRNSQIKSVEVQGYKIRGEFTIEGTEANEQHATFETIGTLNADIQDLLDEKGVTYEYKEIEDDEWWKLLLIYMLPTLLLIGVFYFFFSQSSMGGGKAMSFGKSKAHMLSPDQLKVTFADIAGIDEAKEELFEIVDFLKNPAKYQRLGGRIPKGVLLMGSPGTGKTLLAKGVAGEAGVPFYSISGSDFVEMFVGVGASRVRDLFEQAKKSGRCIIFIDEIDAVGRHRGAGLGGGHDEREQTLNQLLVEMDGFEANAGIIVMAATNRPDVLDPALLRPGRFDRRVVVPTPDVRGRKAILEVHTKGKQLSPDVDLERIAKLTPGASGADLANLVNEAALIAAARDAICIEDNDFVEARDKINMGRERKSMVISDEEKRTTAYHEAGHAIATIALGKAVDPLSKVTIVPRGRALGITYSIPSEDHLSYSKSFLLNQIIIMMGGRVAEEIKFNHLTTGASNDLERATQMAHNMVAKWGMSDALGPLAFADQDEQPFLGAQLSHSRNYSEKTAQVIDEEVRHILADCYNHCRRILNENIDKLTTLAEALCEFETLDAPDIDTLLSDGPEAVRERFKARDEEKKKEKEKHDMRASFSSAIAERLAARSQKDNKKVSLLKSDEEDASKSANAAPGDNPKEEDMAFSNLKEELDKISGPQDGRSASQNVFDSLLVDGDDADALDKLKSKHAENNLLNDLEPIELEPDDKHKSKNKES